MDISNQVIQDDIDDYRRDVSKGAAAGAVKNATLSSGALAARWPSPAGIAGGSRLNPQGAAGGAAPAQVAAPVAIGAGSGDVGGASNKRPPAGAAGGAS